jgi:hypothetical protein
VSILEDLAKKALEQVGQRGPEWIEKLVAEGRKKLPQGSDPETVAVRQTLEYGLAWLENNRTRVGGMGYEGLVAWTANVALRKDREASLVYLRQHAGWDELGSAIRESADKTEKAARDRAEAIEFAKAFGSSAARALLPLLLGVSRAAIGV